MLYQNLSIEDVDKFISYINHYGPSDDVDWVTNDSIAPASHLLRFWDRAKVDFFQMFGNKFILERPIEYARSDAQMRRDMRTSLNTTQFYRMFTDWIYDLLGRDWSDNYCNFCRLVEDEWLISNRTQRDMTLFLGENIWNITKGTKLMKVLKKIAVALNKEQEFEEFRLEHSRVLNQKKLTGTMCLSIHPLDYITMSDNDYDWSSCMNWVEGGDYRMGTVEMLNSPCVIVAYLKGENHLGWGDCKWNSKRWRTLMVVNRNIITTVKGYPYQNNYFNEFLVDWVKELTPAEWGFTAGAHPIHQCGSCQQGDKTYYTAFNASGYMYNDFGTVTHWGVISDNAHERLDIEYCGETECMYCGSICGAFGEAHHVFCADCIDVDEVYWETCDHCGRSAPSEEMYWVGDDQLCQHCYEQLTVICDISGEAVYIDDAIRIYLCETDDGIIVDEPSASYVYAGEWYADEDRWGPSSRWWYSNWAMCAPHPIDLGNGENCYYWNKSELTAGGLRNLYGVYVDR